MADRGLQELERAYDTLEREYNRAPTIERLERRAALIHLLEARLELLTKQLSELTPASAKTNIDLSKKLILLQKQAALLYELEAKLAQQSTQTKQPENKTMQAEITRQQEKLTLRQEATESEIKEIKAIKEALKNRQQNTKPTAQYAPELSTIESSAIESTTGKSFMRNMIAATVGVIALAGYIIAGVLTGGTGILASGAALGKIVLAGGFPAAAAVASSLAVGSILGLAAKAVGGLLFSKMTHKKSKEDLQEPSLLSYIHNEYDEHNEERESLNPSGLRDSQSIQAPPRPSSATVLYEKHKRAPSLEAKDNLEIIDKWQKLLAQLTTQAEHASLTKETENLTLYKKNEAWCSSIVRLLQQAYEEQPSVPFSYKRLFEGPEERPEEKSAERPGASSGPNMMTIPKDSHATGLRLLIAHGDIKQLSQDNNREAAKQLMHDLKKSDTPTDMNARINKELDATLRALEAKNAPTSKGPIAPRLSSADPDSKSSIGSSIQSTTEAKQPVYHPRSSAFLAKTIERGGVMPTIPASPEPDENTDEKTQKKIKK